MITTGAKHCTRIRHAQSMKQYTSWMVVCLFIQSIHPYVVNISLHSLDCLAKGKKALNLPFPLAIFQQNTFRYTHLWSQDADKLHKKHNWCAKKVIGGLPQLHYTNGDTDRALAN